MKTTLLLLGVFVLSQFTMFTYAQEINFDLKNYKTTDYERSSLDVRFNTGNSSSLSNSEQQIDYDESSPFDDYTSNRASNGFSSLLDFNTSYYKTVRQASKIVSYRSSISVSDTYNFSRSKVDELDPNGIKQFRGSYLLSGYYNHNHYYNSASKNYILLHGDVNLRLNHFNEKRSYSDNPDTESGYFKPFDPFTATLKVGHGHGRMEYVEDAVEAMYILNELTQRGVVKKEISNEDVKKLADKITELKRERYFDARLQRMRTMKHLLALLKDDGIIADENVDVYNTVADYHYAAGINARESGQQFEYSIAPLFELNRTDTLDGGYRNHTTKAISADVAYLNSKPISIKWQRDFVVHFGLSRNWSKTTSYALAPDFESEYSDTANFAQLSGRYELGFYPNTRTNFSAVVNAGVNSNFEKDRQSLGLNIGLGLSGYYYISERIRLNVSFNVQASQYYSHYDGYSSTSSSKNHYLNQSFNASIAYYIF